MPLQLNLLHEEFTQERQRKRDPLKLGLKGLAVVGAFLVLFYMFKAYQTLSVKKELSRVEGDWARVEPKVTAAQKRAQELAGIIDATNVLDALIENRFFWAPLLQTLSECVAPNVQLTSFDGTVNEDKLVRLTIEGTAAGEEPRAAAEEFRQLLSEKLGEHYKEVKAEFKTLEDLDTPVTFDGTSMAVARYTISVSLSPQHEPEKAADVPNPDAVKK
jgi:hypothetical protein